MLVHVWLCAALVAVLSGVPASAGSHQNPPSPPSPVAPQGTPPSPRVETPSPTHTPPRTPSPPGERANRPPKRPFEPGTGDAAPPPKRQAGAENERALPSFAEVFPPGTLPGNEEVRAHVTASRPRPVVPRIVLPRRLVPLPGRPAGGPPVIPMPPRMQNVARPPGRVVPPTAPQALGAPIPVAPVHRQPNAIPVFGQPPVGVVQPAALVAPQPAHPLPNFTPFDFVPCDPLPTARVIPAIIDDRDERTRQMFRLMHALLVRVVNEPDPTSAIVNSRLPITGLHPQNEKDGKGGYTTTSLYRHADLGWLIAEMDFLIIRNGRGALGQVNLNIPQHEPFHTAAQPLLRWLWWMLDHLSLIDRQARQVPFLQVVRPMPLRSMVYVDKARLLMQAMLHFVARWELIVGLVTDFGYPAEAQGFSRADLIPLLAPVMEPLDALCPNADPAVRDRAFISTIVMMDNPVFRFAGIQVCSTSSTNNPVTPLHNALVSADVNGNDLCQVQNGLPVPAAELQRMLQAWQAFTQGAAQRRAKSARNVAPADSQ